MDNKETSTYFSGVGDEVLIGLLVAIVVITGLYYVVDHFYHVFFGSNDRNQGNDEQQGRVRASDHDCSICLGEASLAVETNCGHIFCGACIFSYYNLSSSGLTAPPCPYCRQRITMLLPFFSEAERNFADVDDIRERNNLSITIRTYNRRFSGEPRSLVEVIRDLPMLLRHLWSFVWSAEGIHWLFRLRIITLSGAALIYILSPLDIIPEAAFGLLGFIDDIVIMGLFLIYAGILFRNFVAQDL